MTTNKANQLKGKQRATLKDIFHRIFDMDTKRGRVLALGATALISFSVSAIGVRYSNQRVSDLTVATYNGGSISAKDLYEQLKNNMTGSGLVRNTLILDVFGKAYGDKISDKEVEQHYSRFSESDFESIGSENSQMKKLVKNELAFEYGVKQQLNVSDEELKAIYDSGWQPNVTVKYLIFPDENEANAAFTEVSNGTKYDKVKNVGSAIGGLVEENELTYSDNLLGPDLYAMKDGESKILPFKTADASQQPVTYYAVVTMIKNNPNSGKWDDYKKELADIVKQNKIAKFDKDVLAIIQKEFKKANVVVNDEYFKKALSDYTG